LSIRSSIPSNLLPPLSGEALRIASEELKSHPQQKLDWLQVAEKLLQPDYGIGVLLLMEIAATKRAAENSYSLDGGFTHKWHCCDFFRGPARHANSLPQIPRFC